MGPVTITGETTRNNGLKFCTERFICLSISRFIYLIFPSTLADLNILNLYQLFRDFMSLFGRFRFWAPTRFPEVICLRYYTGYISEMHSEPCQTSKMSFLQKLLTAERKRILQKQILA